MATPNTVEPDVDLGQGIRYSNGKFYQGDKEVQDKTMQHIYAKKKYDEYLANTTKKQGEIAGDKQQELATEFRSNLPKYTGLLKDQANKTIQRNLAEKVQGLKQQSANRGLLGGTGTMREQADAVAGAESEVAGKSFDIQDALEDQAQQFENQALATKLSMQGSANQAYIDQLRQNIIDTQRQNELWKTLGGVAGSGIGAYYGRKGEG